MLSSKSAPGYSVVVDEKGVPGLSAGYSWGYINGFNSAASLKGDYSDWVFAKGANEGALGTGTIISAGTDAVTFLSSPAWGTGTPIWLGVPIAVAGYRTFRVSLTSSLNQDLNVSAWFMPEISNQFVGVNLSTSGGPLFAQSIVTAEILNGTNNLSFGPGGKDLSVFSAGPQGYLVIQFAKTTTPTSGNIRVGIERQK